MEDDIGDRGLLTADVSPGAGDSATWRGLGAGPLGAGWASGWPGSLLAPLAPCRPPVLTYWPSPGGGGHPEGSGVGPGLIQKTASIW